MGVVLTTCELGRPFSEVVQDIILIRIVCLMNVSQYIFIGSTVNNTTDLPGPYTLTRDGSQPGTTPTLKGLPGTGMPS
jgi:hypothetical protein